MRRRSALALPALSRRLALALPALALPVAPRAQGWAPQRPLRLVIPFPPGGTTDLVGRMVAERLGPRLGQPVVVENRAGAGGNVGGEFVVRADPDGHTLLFTTIGTGAMNHAVYGARMPWRPEEMASVGLVTRVPNVVMAPAGSPVRDFAGFLAAAKEREVTYGSSGIGGSPHVCMELIGQVAGLRLTHVPFRGSGPMLTELLAGRLDFAMDNIPSAIGHIQGGRILALAMTGARRATLLPQVPVVAETIAGFEATAWFGVQAGARNPPAALARIGAELDAITRDGAFRARLAEFGGAGPDLTPEGGTTPEAFSSFVAAEVTKWGEVIRRAAIRAE